MDPIKTNDNSFIIMEGDEPRYDCKITEDVYTKGTNRVKFETVLQEADTPNSNNRIYDKSILQEGIESTCKRCTPGNLLGELDHPFGQDVDIQRQATVMYREASHRIWEHFWENNLLMGKLETLSEGNGKILGGLIRDGVKVGFSLRALGGLKEEGSVKRVTRPFRYITYDSVHLPSNVKAYITKLQEGLSIDQIFAENVDIKSDINQYLRNKYISGITI